METVFHDVPFAPGLKTFDKVELIGQVHSQVTPTRELIVADLRQIALRRLGIERSQLIDTEKDRYPQTRAWAAAIHDQCPDLDGLCWVSRQDDSALALLLFGDRVSSGDLKRDGEPIAIATDLDTFTRLLKLAERIGLNIIDGIIEAIHHNK
jgi:RES domain